MFAVEDGVGELGDPVAEDEESLAGGEHEVELDVAVAVDEVIDVGVGCHVLLGVDDEVLAVLTKVFEFAGGVVVECNIAVEECAFCSCLHIVLLALALLA